MGPAAFCLFSSLSHEKYCIQTINDRSVDGVLGTRTRGGRMVGADESTEIWRHPTDLFVYIVKVECADEVWFTHTLLLLHSTEKF